MGKRDFCKKNDVIIDTINYNGKYIDSNDFKKKIVSASICVIGAIVVGIIFLL